MRRFKIAFKSALTCGVFVILQGSIYSCKKTVSNPAAETKVVNKIATMATSTSTVTINYTSQLKRINGKYLLLINDVKYWEGELKSKPGIVGIALSPRSYLFTEKFVVDARKLNGHITYGFHEALLNSGNYFKDWYFKKDSVFFYGQGAVSKKDSSFAKWNFDGKGFELLLPRGPQYGTVFIYLDGVLLKKISLKTRQNIKSSVVFKSQLIKKGSHSLYIKSLDGLLPVDCINIKL